MLQQVCLKYKKIGKCHFFSQITRTCHMRTNLLVRVVLALLSLHLAVLKIKTSTLLREFNVPENWILSSVLQMFPVVLRAVLIKVLHLFCWKLWHRRRQPFTYIALLIAQPPFSFFFGLISTWRAVSHHGAVWLIDWALFWLHFESQWCECCLQSVQSVPSPASF